MKKFLLIPLLLCSSLFALPLGNPMDASLYQNGLFCGDSYDRCCDPCDPCFDWCDAWSFRLGFYGDYVFDRHMELDGRGGKDIDNFEINTNAAFLALNFCDRVDLFATLGATNFSMRANSGVFAAIGDGVVEVDTETAFSWSIGGRMTVWSCDCFNFGIEGQYFATKPDVDNYVLRSDTVRKLDDQYDMKYCEWQVGIGAAYMMRVGCSGISLVPYTGIKWAGSKADFNRELVDGSEILPKLENKKLWGWALGTTLVLCDAVSMTVEGRWADEKALHVNGQFRF